MRNTRSNRCISASARLVSPVLACSSGLQPGLVCLTLPALACNRGRRGSHPNQEGVSSQLLLYRTAPLG